LAIPRHERIQVTEVCEPLGSTLGHPGNDDSAVAVAYQDYIVKVLELEHVRHVLDMSIQINREAAQVGSLT